MSDTPIFVRMLNDQGVPYPSYVTLQRLVEASGLPWIDQTEMNIHAGVTYILPIINGNSLVWGHAKRKAKLLAWQLERCLHGYDAFAPSCFDQVWVGDRSHHYHLKDRPYVRYVPVGGHPDIGRPRIEPKWDLAACCYTYGRRAAILSQIKEQGYAIAPNAFPPERETILSQCRAGLSVHQADNDHAINELRLVLFAMHRLPLICEHVRDSFPYRTYGLENISDGISDRNGYADINYRAMTEEFEFRKVVEAACREC